tara:strand:- start:357 stop:584 length:228 start_codon:yes stop_codon:yes gene_type:complete
MSAQQREELTVTDVSKGQKIRALDVLFIGPFMIYVATQSKLTMTERYIMFGLGAATLIYNAKNYIETQRNLENEQ